MDLRRLVRELVHDERHEVAEHDVDDRTHAGHRRSQPKASDPGFGDRSVEHAFGSELLDEAREDLERRPGLGDILADDEDHRIPPQLLR